MKSPITRSFSSLLKPDLNAEIQIGQDQGIARQPTRVGAGVIGAASRSLTDIRLERDSLKAQLAAAGPMDISPDLIDPSPFPDRLQDDSNLEFESLKKTIEEEGQKVAIQVRVHPADDGRYQVVYGHRRLRAARELGRPVRVQLVKLTDGELAVAQGIENSARQNLTWIERALFAWKLEKAGIKAKGIRAALSVDDAELARFRSVCRALPTDLIELIGRAPHIGRPRWLHLAGTASDKPHAVEAVRKTLSAAKDLASDDRFRVVLNSLTAPPVPVEEPSAAEFKSPDGKLFGRILVSARDLKITAPRELTEPFAAFMKQQMPELLEKFFASQARE